MLNKLAAWCLCTTVFVALGSSTGHAKDPYKHYYKQQEKQAKAYYKYQRKQAKAWEKFERKHPYSWGLYGGRAAW
jgi:hypothetical protein